MIQAIYWVHGFSKSTSKFPEQVVPLDNLVFFVFPFLPQLRGTLHFTFQSLTLTSKCDT